MGLLIGYATFAVFLFTFSVHNDHSSAKSGTQINYFLKFICDGPRENCLNPSRNNWKFYGYSLNTDITGEKPLVCLWLASTVTSVFIPG